MLSTILKIKYNVYTDTLNFWKQNLYNSMYSLLRAMMYSDRLIVRGAHICISSLFFGRVQRCLALRCTSSGPCWISEWKTIIILGSMLLLWPIFWSWSVLITVWNCLNQQLLGIYWIFWLGFLYYVIYLDFAFPNWLPSKTQFFRSRHQVRQQSAIDVQPTSAQPWTVQWR